MSVGTATVETLTAEVRVLMVGSRQVTLSVVKQLDAVAWDQMEPFGRVRCTNPNVTSSVMLIGRHRRDGVLVVAEMPQVYWRVYIGELPEPVTVCSYFSAGDPDLRCDGRRIEVDPKSVKGCADIEHRWSATKHCDPLWNLNGNEELIRERIAEHDLWAARIKAVAKMPLIVLAGLK